MLRLTTEVNNDMKTIFSKRSVNLQTQSTQQTQKYILFILSHFFFYMVNYWCILYNMYNIYQLVKLHHSQPTPYLYQIVT